jgi:putative membrane protein
LIRSILHFLQGVGIGAANVIPGVSGGTMALVFGIYERLIEIASRAVRAGVSLVRLDFRGFAEGVRSLPWLFILPLALGIVVAPLTGAHVIPQAMDTWPVHSRALFFGLILGSIAVPWLRIRSAGQREVGLAVLAAAAAFFLTGLPPGSNPDPTLLQYFLAAAVAICAMVLPGVSGAFLLLVLGMYAPVLRAVDERQLVVVGVFLLGTFSGLGVFAVFMGWLLRRFHDQTMAVLVGLMAGSLRALWPWLGPDRELEWYGGHEPLAGVLGLLAAGLVLSGIATLYEARRVKAEKAASEAGTGRDQ